jgi:hypothetical protein
MEGMWLHAAVIAKVLQFAFTCSPMAQLFTENKFYILKYILCSLIIAHGDLLKSQTL